MTLSQAGHDTASTSAPASDLSGFDFSSKPVFAIPEGLRYGDGPFAHQGEAVQAWCQAGYRGVLAMATGSGKTNAALICAYELHQQLRSNRRPLLIVVAAPYKPLIDQWCGEIARFGLEPKNLTTLGGEQKRSQELRKLARRLKLGSSEVEVVVVTHATLRTPEFLASVEAFDGDRLLIADEVHNLGSESFIVDPPEFFQHRLGLSATPIRQYDEAGSQALLGFFGQVVFEFSLSDAIGVCLVEYDYFMHPVQLTASELEEWAVLTEAIVKQYARKQADSNPTEYLLKLLFERRTLLETASNKILELEALLAREAPGDLRHILIYATDKAPQQLESINQLLNSKNLKFHQLTSEETADPKKTARIITAFQEGELQILTAKRVLDEGVDIPQVKKAFILASTTVQRQWIQRRGRLLRTCAATDKTHSVIHDFITLPPKTTRAVDDNTKNIIKSELSRSQEFAQLAKNAASPDGPLSQLQQMAEAAYL